MKLVLPLFFACMLFKTGSGNRRRTTAGLFDEHDYAYRQYDPSIPFHHNEKKEWHMMYPMLPTEKGGGVENEATADGYNGDQQTVWPGGEGKNEAAADRFNGAKANAGVFNLILFGAALAVSLQVIES